MDNENRQTPPDEPYSLLRRILQGIQIFDRHGATEIDAQHDEIWAGPGLDPTEETDGAGAGAGRFTTDELAELERLRWTWDDSNGSWHHNT